MAKFNARQMTLNRWAGIGKVLTNPKVRRSNGNGVTIANFQIEQQDPIRGPNGEKTFRRTTVPIVARGKPAEIAADLLREGDPVYIEGKLQNVQASESGSPMEVFAQRVHALEVDDENFDDFTEDESQYNR